MERNTHVYRVANPSLEASLQEKGVKPLTTEALSHEYREDVRAIAKEAVAIADPDKREEFIWESVDGSEWIIQLLVSDNPNTEEHASPIAVQADIYDMVERLEE